MPEDTELAIAAKAEETFTFLMELHPSYRANVTPWAMRKFGRLPVAADFTCGTCPAAPDCRSAFDGYNTDGDCLEEK